MDIAGNRQQAQTKSECESSPGELPKRVQMHLKATFLLSAGDAHTKRRITSQKHFPDDRILKK